MFNLNKLSLQSPFWRVGVGTRMTFTSFCSDKWLPLNGVLVAIIALKTLETSDQIYIFLFVRYVNYF